MPSDSSNTQHAQGGPSHRGTMDTGSHRRGQPQRPRQQEPPPPLPSPPAFSWSSSLMTMVTLLGSFIILCTYASSASTLFAFYAARPMYAGYPSVIAAMLIGGVCAFICYVPTMAAVATFEVLFDTDIRQNGTPPPGAPGVQRTRASEMAWSLAHDGASAIKLGLVLAPVYILTLGRPGNIMVEGRSMEAAAGGQLAAAILTLKIMVVGLREIWGLVPMVVLRWNRDARR